LECARLLIDEAPMSGDDALIDSSVDMNGLEFSSFGEALHLVNPQI
jgi:hypothetical protein